MSTSPPVLYFSLPFNRNICCHHCCFRGNQAVINIKLINTFRYPVSRVQLCNAFESRELRDVILYKGGREAAAGRADRLCNNGIVAQRHNSCISTILLCSCTCSVCLLQALECFEEQTLVSMLCWCTNHPHHNYGLTTRWRFWKNIQFSLPDFCKGQDPWLDSVKFLNGWIWNS